MFDSIDEMVEENDRRRLEDDLYLEDGTAQEYACLLFENRHLYVICSQDRLYRGYQLLIQHIPNLKQKLLSQDVVEMNAYFRDVNSEPFQR